MIRMENLYKLAKGAVPIFLALGASACSSDGPCDPDKPGTVCTIIGNGERGFDGAEGPAVEARLDQPQDMKVAPNGELWLIDFNNYQIRAVDEEGTIRTILGTGLLGDSPPEGETAWPASDSAFNHVCDMAFGDDGYLYLAAWHNSRLKRLNIDTLMLENYGGIGKRTLYYGEGGQALEAAMDLPSSVDFLPDGSLIFMDQGNQVLRTIGTDGVIERYAGQCIVDFDTPCADGEEPVACPENDKTVCGGLESCDDPCSPGFEGDEEHRLDMRMAQPFGQAADPTGRLVVAADGSVIFADTSNHRIRMIGTDDIVTTVAGTGVPGYSGDGGPATEAEINHPVDVDVAEDGTIYFTDVENSCIRGIDPSGNIYTVAGVCSDNPDDRGFKGDGGDALGAVFDRPYGIELSPDESKLYIADTFNHRIRVLTF